MKLLGCCWGICELW